MRRSSPPCALRALALTLHLPLSACTSVELERRPQDGVETSYGSGAAVPDGSADSDAPDRGRPAAPDARSPWAPGDATPIVADSGSTTPDVPTPTDALPPDASAALDSVPPDATAPILHAKPLDLDGDGRSDLVLLDRRTGAFWVRSAGGGTLAFGTEPLIVGGVTPALGDYDGDGTVDLGAVDAAGTLQVRTVGGASLGSQVALPGVPVPCDWNGDGATDPAAFTPHEGRWRATTLGGTPLLDTVLGPPGAIPVAADWDGDGRCEPATWDRATGTWSIATLSGDIQATLVLGSTGAIPVAADWDGDGAADAAVFEPATGAWIVDAQVTVGPPLGGPDAVPLVGDWDGDGAMDRGVWEPRTATFVTATLGGAAQATIPGLPCALPAASHHAKGGPQALPPGALALLPLDEGNGAAWDHSGRCHPGDLKGQAGWAGGVKIAGDDGLLLIADHAELREGSFTWDLWFEAASTPGNGRLMAQAKCVGGKGPDVLERSGYPALRINDKGAVFNPPLVGSRSNDGPPDHWGVCDEKFHKGSGPEHLVITHDATDKRVRMFLGLQGKPLDLCFDATYTGSYGADTSGIAIGNMPCATRPFPATYHQVAVWGRPLGFETNESGNVTAGEVRQSHDAGPAATLALDQP